MRNRLGLVLWITFASTPLLAQTVEITPYYGYQFGDGFLVSTGEVNYKAGQNWGVIFDIEIEDDLKFEFFYSRQNTELRFRGAGLGIQETLSDMTVQYFHGGILYEVDASDRVRGFFTGTAGLTFFDPERREFDSEWKFSVAGGAGVKLFASDNIGFRLQGRLLFPILAAGGGFGCGFPGGCFVGINTWATVSGDVNAGLILAF